jgi:hypothetical protein
VARCEPIIDATFLQTVTGADISDTARVDELISVVSDLCAEELLGPNRCVNPELAPMRLKVVVAEYVYFNMKASSTEQIVRAETVGDYRVEYQTKQIPGFDLNVLRAMLKPLRIRYYTLRTMDDLTNEPYVPFYAVERPA